MARNLQHVTETAGSVLTADMTRARAYARSSKAPNTLRAYQSDFRYPQGFALHHRTLRAMG